MVVNYTYRAFGEQLKKLDKSNNETEDLGKYVLIADLNSPVLYNKSALRLNQSSFTVRWLTVHGGKELDEDINLYYFNARFYDATTGRFINVDPIQDGTNWYVYCSNNPLSFVDPTGLDSEAVGLSFTFTNPIEAFKKGANKVQDILPGGKEKSDWFKTSPIDTVSLSFGVYRDYDIKDYFDKDTTEVGVYGSVGAGGGFPSYSAAIEVIKSNYDSEISLEGTAIETGMGLGPIEASLVFNEDNEIIATEAAFTIDLNPIAVDFHVIQEEGGTFSFFSEDLPESND